MQKALTIAWALVSLTLAASLAHGQPRPANASSARTTTAGAIVYGHHHLNVDNLDEARRFWADTLGGTAEQRGPLEIVRFPDVLIVLSARPATGGSKGTTVNHIGFLVPSLRRVLDAVTAAGFPVITAAEVPASYPVKDDIAFSAPTNGHIAFVMAPGGVKVELTEAAAQATPVANHHVHFYTDSVEATKAWYVKTFSAVPGMRGTFQAADLPNVNLTFSATPEPVVGTRGRALDHIGFEVKNLRAFCQQLEAAGVTFDRPYSVVPALGIGVAFLTDPDGTYIELTEGLIK